MAQRKPSSPKEKREQNKKDREERALALEKRQKEALEARAREEIPEGRGTMLVMGLISIFLTGARLVAGKTVGFGDSEALYASYALFPQAAYLDHPGLVGMVARAIGGGLAPSAMNAHSVTTTISMFTPWIGFAAARMLGAARRGSALTGIALTVAPEMAVGLFALTPDTLLAPLWLATLACAFAAFRAPKASLRAGAAFLAAGFLAGVATTAKVSGVCLLLTLAIAYVRAARSNDAGHADARAHARTQWPWLGLVVGAIPLVPIVTFEHAHGWAMFRHRLVEMQAGGPRLATIGAVLGGQLLYVSPIFLALAFVIGRALYRKRSDGIGASLLSTNMLVSLAVLVPVSLVSRNAEPHWLAPIFLPIAIFASTVDEPIRFGRAGGILAAAMSAFVYAWVLVPDVSKLWPRSIDQKGDITTELFGWPATINAVAETVEGARVPLDPNDVVVVGPHWTICGQLRAGLAKDVDVGCLTPMRDDFDDWLPRESWKKRGTVILVATDQHPVDEPAQLLPDFNVDSDSRVSMFRGGKPVRTFHIFVLKRRAQT
jgi:hypothetical protein